MEDYLRLSRDLPALSTWEERWVVYSAPTLSIYTPDRTAVEATLDVWKGGVTAHEDLPEAFVVFDHTLTPTVFRARNAAEKHRWLSTL